MSYLLSQVKTLLREPQAFARFGSNPRLRGYQKGVMDAVCHSVLNELGLSHVVLFPRQSGKNELQAHLEVYLMTLLSQHPVEMVKVTPTIEPQAQTGMRRFERIAKHNPLIQGAWKKEGKRGFRIGQARMTFLSAAPGSNIVGATASGLLEVDEAQHVSIQKFDRDVSPMSASTCATHVFWGTAWTSTTLLGRELRAAQEAEKKDGVRRVFKLTAEDIYTEVPAYRKFVEEKVARQGRNHPMVRTQYFSEEIDGQGGMFPAERMARLSPKGRVATNFTQRAGGSSTLSVLKPSGITALLLDVAGEDEEVRGMDGTMSMSNPARDATALTLVEIVMENELINGNEMVGRSSKLSGGEDNPVDTANKVSDASGRPTLQGIASHKTLGCANPMQGAGVNPARTTEANDHTTPRLPIYRVVQRWQWIGANHVVLQGLIREIALEWKARAVVVDATGVGAGLASFLERALPGRVTPFTFNNASKSKLGWDFLAIVDSRRWQEPELQDLPGDDQLRYQKEFFEQLAACQFEVRPGAGQQMHWGVPDSSRSPLSGEALHDDWVLSAALAAVLDRMDWRPSAPSFVVPAPDPLREMDGNY